MAAIDYLIEGFNLYNKTLSKIAVNYEMLDCANLLVTLDDGRRVIYNDTSTGSRILSDRNNFTDDEYKRELGYRLYYLMRRKFITGKELSEMTGISEHTISTYVCEKTIPSAANLERIANALGVDIGYFKL